MLTIWVPTVLNPMVSWRVTICCSSIFRVGGKRRGGRTFSGATGRIWLVFSWAGWWSVCSYLLPGPLCNYKLRKKNAFSEISWHRQIRWPLCSSRSGSMYLTVWTIKTIFSRSLILCIMGRIGMTEIILILLVVVLLFGGRKIPELMKGLGQGLKAVSYTHLLAAAGLWSAYSFNNSWWASSSSGGGKGVLQG